MAYTELHNWATLEDDLLNKILEATIYTSRTRNHAPYISKLRLVCKHWCQAAGRCRSDLKFMNNPRVSSGVQLGTVLGRSFSGVSSVSIWGNHNSPEAIDSLGQLPHLTKLGIYSYSGPGITATHFTRLQSLTLHCTFHLRAKWLPVSVPHLQGLTELNLHHTSHSISGADLGSLSELQSLRALGLAGQKDPQQACSILPCLTLLTRLGLTSSLVTDESLTVLQALTGLEVLDLDAGLESPFEKTTRLTDAIIPTIVGLRRLRHLDLSGSKISDAAMPHIALLTNLQNLGLDNCAKISDAAMPHIALLTNLQELGLDYCACVGQAGLQQLKGLTQLKIFNAQPEGFTDDYSDYIPDIA